MKRADEGDRRTALNARKEAALRRWPDRASPEFEAEMTAIARELDLLARDLDSSDTDPIERLRTWCAVGEAYLLLGEQAALHCATAAFRYAEAAAAKAEADARELVNLRHQHGLALLRLAQDTHLEWAAEAATHLSSALSLARKHMPVGVAGIKFELFRAEHTVTQLRGSRRAERRDEQPAREAEAA